MKTITIQDDALLEKAIKKAEAENTTVEALVQRFLEVYVREIPTREHLDKVKKELQKYFDLNASEWTRERRNED